MYLIIGRGVFQLADHPAAGRDHQDREFSSWFASLSTISLKRRRKSLEEVRIHRLGFPCTVPIGRMCGLFRLASWIVLFPIGRIHRDILVYSFQLFFDWALHELF